MSQEAIVVTGATSGIGMALAKSLVIKGEKVIIGCRNPEKAEELINNIKTITPTANIYFYQLDLEKIDSVNKFCKEVISNHKIKAVVNNAGTMYKHFSTTDEGVESTVAVNYLATRSLTSQLLPYLKGGAVIFTGSVTYKLGKIDNTLYSGNHKNYKRMKSYYNSKLALTLYAKELSESCDSTLITVIDPGVVNTGIISMQSWYDKLADIFFRPFIRTPEKASQLHIKILESKSRDYHGKIFSYRGIKDIITPKKIDSSIINNTNLCGKQDY